MAHSELDGMSQKLGMGRKSWIPNWKQLEQHFITNLLPVNWQHISNIIRYKKSILEFIWSKEYSRPIYWSAKNIPSRWTSFSGKTAYFSKAMLNCTLHLFPHNCFIVKKSGCCTGLPALQTCHHLKTFVTLWNEKYEFVQVKHKRRPQDSWAARSLNQIMQHLSSPKCPAAGLLSSQDGDITQC